jgi:uncharacterized protein (TIGR02231 family)
MPSFARPFAFALVSALLCSTALRAEEIPLQSTIDAVTVFSNGASITRAGSVSAPVGQHVLLLSGLPEAIDPDTIRIAGTGIEAMTIIGIDARVSAGKAIDDSAYQLKRRALIDRLETERGAHEALTARKSSMLKFANALPNQLSGEKSALEIDRWPDAWKAIGAGIETVNKDLQAANRRISDLEAEIAALDNAQQTGSDAGVPRRDIAISIEASAAITGKLEISYQSYGANWRPVYDARLVTGGPAPSLELTSRAVIAQNTGEDWKDASLSLSTVSLNKGAEAPRLDTLAVVIDVPEEGRLRRTSDDERAQDGAAIALAAPAPAPEAEPNDIAVTKPAPQQQATLDLGAYQATFAIKERVTLPSDGSQKTVLVGRSTLAPELVVKAVPALDQAAYLEARFKAPADTPMLAGTVTLRRDDVFVGRGAIGLVPPGEEATLGFGVDDAVKVERNPLRRRTNDPSPTGTRSEQEDFRTSVKNLHDFPVAVTVLDRLPVSENTAITVEALSTNTAPTDKTVDNRRGVQGWSFTLKPAESRDIRFGWRLRHPADRSINWVAMPN